MDPEELQEVGLFILLGIVWAMLMRSRLGGYEQLVTVIIAALFIIGTSLVAYGMLLVRKTGRSVQRVDGKREGQGDR